MTGTLKVWVNGKEVEATTVTVIVTDEKTKIQIKAGVSEEGGPWVSQEVSNVETGDVSMFLEHS